MPSANDAVSETIWELEKWLASDSPSRERMIDSLKSLAFYIAHRANRNSKKLWQQTNAQHLLASLVNLSDPLRGYQHDYYLKKGVLALVSRLHVITYSQHARANESQLRQATTRARSASSGLFFAYDCHRRLRLIKQENVSTPSSNLSPQGDHTRFSTLLAKLDTKQTNELFFWLFKPTTSERQHRERQMQLGIFARDTGISPHDLSAVIYSVNEYRNQMALKQAQQEVATTCRQHACS